ncbi:MAG: cytochrome ubiquinol oxidase subunit I [Alphaproteobacteria bacterium]|nr:MAG: cytochrome ubiquinol oxidase subunit I [Alphaproteobacteria bacterium]
MIWDAVVLSRLQFAFTVGFHILFPTFTIGLASFLMVLEASWIKTGKPVYLQLFRFWSRIFALGFGVGVVTGVVLSYQFGTNFGPFTAATANVLGPLLGYEVLTAFFLEAGFIGVMLFGLERVGPRQHFIATCCVAVGTVISAFWILSANSWMQTPAGFHLIDGKFHVSNWLEAIFNPSFPYRFAHMVLAAYMTAAFMVLGVHAWYMLRGEHPDFARKGLALALLMAAITAPLQAVIGDVHGQNSFAHQPMKVAAIEGRWETMAGAPLLLFALPNQKEARNEAEIGIPKLASLILTHDADGVVPGLDQVEAKDRPPVAIVFFAFRLMVGCGTALLVLAGWGVYLAWRRKLYDNRLFLRAAIAAVPLGFIATISGWTVAEVGRQPWTVYKLMRTSDSVSHVTAGEVSFSLALFVLVYGCLLMALVYYMLRMIVQGPKAIHENEEVLVGREMAARPPVQGDDA